MTTTDPAMAADPVAAARHAADVAEPEFGRYFLIHFLGLSIDYLDESKPAQSHLPFAQHLCNAAGVVHGGVLSTVLDISMGHACRQLPVGRIDDRDGDAFPSAPSVPTRSAPAIVLHGGRRIVHLESKHARRQLGGSSPSASGSWFRQRRP